MVDYSKMRRSDREVTSLSDILDILRRTQTIRLGLNGNPYPYVVPISFGFEAPSDGGTSGVAIYIHGASEGLKHNLIANDNHVCVEADITHRITVRGEGDDKSITTEYESVIGYGTAETVTGAEAEKGLALLLEHSGHPDIAYEKTILEKIIVYKITLTDIKGKRNIL